VTDPTQAMPGTGVAVVAAATAARCWVGRHGRGVARRGRGARPRVALKLVTSRPTRSARARRRRGRRWPGSTTGLVPSTTPAPTTRPPWVVMELVEGETLADTSSAAAALRAHGGRRPLDRRGAAYVHARGCCTATSSPATSWSAPTGGRGSPTSASPGSSTRHASPPPG
jgi:hypothetical protein